VAHGVRPAYYDVLGLEATATPEEIRASWKRLIQENHPDHAPPSEREAATVRAAAINEAYQTLIDPQRRARYDRATQRMTPSDNVEEVASSARRRFRGERRRDLARAGGAALFGLAAFAYTLRWLRFW
jgi:curved DNA-binding protein CbpA